MRFIDSSTDEAEAIRAEDLRKKRKQAIVGFVVGIPLMVLMFLPIMSHHTMAYFMFVVSTPAFIYVSHPIFRAGWRALKNRNLNMDVMYSMGIGVSFVASILGTFQIILTREFLFYDSAVMLAAMSVDCLVKEASLVASMPLLPVVLAVRANVPNAAAL